MSRSSHQQGKPGDKRLRGRSTCECREYYVRVHEGFKVLGMVGFEVVMVTTVVVVTGDGDGMDLNEDYQNSRGRFPQPCQTSLPRLAPHAYTAPCTPSRPMALKTLNKLEKTGSERQEEDAIPLKQKNEPRSLYQCRSYVLQENVRLKTQGEERRPAWREGTSAGQGCWPPPATSTGEFRLLSPFFRYSVINTKKRRTAEELRGARRRGATLEADRRVQMMGSGGEGGKEGGRREGAAEEEEGERGDLVRKKKILIRGAIGRRAGADVAVVIRFKIE
ncbi:hypothetical protein O3P69_013572 [Scylla paramamosain]|uniref:Uncharacterized protein n=1 Tax=Scylla paramamosain TaxID=85552 RepID=A0AAW0SPT4_SCYPA